MQCRWDSNEDRWTGCDSRTRCQCPRDERAAAYEPEDFDEAVVGIGTLPPEHECPVPGEWCTDCRAQFAARGFTVPEPVELPLALEDVRRARLLVEAHDSLRRYEVERERRRRDEVASYFSFIGGVR